MIKVIKVPFDAKSCSSMGIPYVPDRLLEETLNKYGNQVIQVMPVNQPVTSALAVTTFVVLIDTTRTKSIKKDGGKDVEDKDLE